MRQSDIIRGLLRNSPDGLTTQQIADHFETLPRNVFKTIRRSRGIRVIRWERTAGVGRPRVIWGLGFGKDESPPPKKYH